MIEFRLEMGRVEKPMGAMRHAQGVHDRRRTPVCSPADLCGYCDGGVRRTFSRSFLVVRFGSFSRIPALDWRTHEL